MGSLIIPSHIYFLSEDKFCNQILDEMQNKKIALFISDSSIKRLQLEDWHIELSNNNTVRHYNHIPSNPTYKDIFHAILNSGNDKLDFIIAIGGGSAIDMAKAYSGLLYLRDKKNFNEEDILYSLISKEYLQHKGSTSIYALPTTAGTGSEVTSWATIWDMDSNVKYSIDASWLYPKKAYIVAGFTCTMPARLTLSTGLDALCQAIEAYWAKASNPMVRALSISAIKTIVKYLPKALKDLDNLYYREKMCLGSLFSGLAFTNTRTTACHSISYPLTMKYGIEHGIACALTLAKVLEINIPKIIEVDELFKALGIGNATELQKWIDDVSSGIVEMRLSAFSIKEADIAELSSLSFTQGRMDNNPVDITESDVNEILQSVM